MDELKNKVIKLLKDNPKGLTIAQLVKKTKAGRSTILIRLKELEMENRLIEQKVGSAKLLFLKGGGKK